MITLFYLDKYNRRVEFKVSFADFDNARLELLEASFTESLGTVYVEHPDGTVVELDYYNL